VTEGDVFKQCQQIFVYTLHCCIGIETQQCRVNKYQASRIITAPEAAHRLRTGTLDYLRN
jgi:hypothetical protein